MPCVVPFNHVSAVYEFNIYLQQQQRARTAGAASWAPSVRSSGCWIPLRRNLSPPPQQKKKARNGVGNTAPCTDNKMLHHLLSLVSLFFNLRFSVCLLNWIIVSWHRHCHCLTDKQADSSSSRYVEEEEVNVENKTEEQQTEQGQTDDERQIRNNKSDKTHRVTSMLYKMQYWLPQVNGLVVCVWEGRRVPANCWIIINRIGGGKEIGLIQRGHFLVGESEGGRDTTITMIVMMRN